MPEDTTESESTTDESTFVVSGNIAEIKTQLMQLKNDQKKSKQQGAPLVINAEQFRGTIKPTDKPKVTLYFLQKPGSVRGGYKQLEAQPSFRLVSQSSDPGQWTDTMYQTLAEKIYSKFATPLFSWQKGKELLTYTDPSKGYANQIWCINKVEGHRVMESILDIQGHSYDLQYENHKTNSAPSEKYTDTPEKRTIRGKEKRKRRVGATGTVWFRYAFLTFPGWDEVVMLCDTSGSKVDPVLITAPVIRNYNVGERTYDQVIPSDSTL